MKKIHSLNAVICIAAGKSQVPVILKAKTLGYTIIAIDQNKKAPGFDFADFSFIEEPAMKQWLDIAHPDLAKFI